mgnify:CR=1 FL=1
MPTSQEETLSRSWNVVEALATRIDSAGGRVAVIVAAVFLCVAAGYLIGSINPAILISRRVFHKDIRESGSGNAGTTNILRTYGKKYAVLTLLLDMLKAAVPVLLGYLLYGTVGAPIAGFFCVFGHMFPLYYHFRGGKGVACTAMVMLLLSPLTFAVILFCFVVIVALTRYVSLASVMCALLYPLVLQAFRPANGVMTLMAILTTVFVVFMHRANIKRLYDGKESKLELHFGRKKKNGDEAANGDATDGGEDRS